MLVHVQKAAGARLGVHLVKERGHITVVASDCEQLQEGDVLLRINGRAPSRLNAAARMLVNADRLTLHIRRPDSLRIPLLPNTQTGPR